MEHALAVADTVVFDVAESPAGHLRQHIPFMRSRERGVFGEGSAADRAPPPDQHALDDLDASITDDQKRSVSECVFPEPLRRIRSLPAVGTLHRRATVVPFANLR